MDLIGASNTPEPVTVNPLTGNAIAGFTTSDIDMDTSEDTSGSTAEPMSDSSTYTTDKTRTVYPFESLKPGQQDSVIRLHSEIAHAWDIASPASPFPYEYQPDPDVLNWGHAILIALSRLAQMTRLPKSLQGQAVQHVIDHIRERNDGEFIYSITLPSLTLRCSTNRKIRILSTRGRPCSPRGGHPVRNPHDASRRNP
jgi:hypothetical protein